MVEGFQKIAKRITIGIVLAALIVGGAALLMRVETTFRPQEDHDRRAPKAMARPCAQLRSAAPIPSRRR